MPKEVFMFFSEAYKVLLSIYKYKYRKEQEAKQKEYVAYKDSEKLEMLDKLKKNLLETLINGLMKCLKR